MESRYKEVHPMGGTDGDPGPRDKPERKIPMSDKEQELSREIVNILGEWRDEGKDYVVQFSFKPLAIEIIAKLKAMGYEQVWRECPDCIDGKIFSEPSIKGRDASATLSWGTIDCLTCKGTGKKRKLVKWNSEKVAEKLSKIAHPCDGEEWDRIKYTPYKEMYRNYADQLYKE